MNLHSTQPTRDLNVTTPFTIEEIIPLLHSAVVRKQTKQSMQIRDIGIVCGLLTLNEEPEIVVKFADNISQYTRSEFYSQFRILEPPQL